MEANKIDLIHWKSNDSIEVAPLTNRCVENFKI